MAASDLVRHTLLARIHRHYRTMTETVHVGHRPYSFTRIADPNQVLDEVAEKEILRIKLGDKNPAVVRQMPYWAELWESSLGLSQYLLKIGMPPAFRNVSALDLGCGMGFVGMVASSLGASILLADMEPLALLFAQLNCLNQGGHIRTRQLDWQQTCLPERFELILGGDILYDRTQWQYLDFFWRYHLGPRGRVLLGEPGRQTGDAFPDWIKSRGWTVVRYEEHVATNPRPINIFELSRA